MNVYARVIVPRPLEGTFTYRVPDELLSAAGVGKRVVVPFGGKRFVTGVIESLSPVKDSDVINVKDIQDVLDVSPMVVHPQIKLWQWLADYYMCAVGDVFKAAMPQGLKPESESVVEFSDDAEAEIFEGLTSRDMELVTIVREKKKNIGEGTGQVAGCGKR